jgi:hypothetical protein
MPRGDDGRELLQLSSEGVIPTGHAYERIHAKALP